MKKLAVLVFAISCLSCKSSHSQRKVNSEAISIDAIKLNNEASKLYYKVFFYEIEPIDEKERIQLSNKALSLLNRAIAIDSNFYMLYRNKLAFQILLSQQDIAFLTAKLIVKKWPDEESTKIILGKFYELKGDTISAFESYKNALSAINYQLSSTDVVDNMFKYEQKEKATVLILLNQPEEAHSILRDLIGKEINETIKRGLNRLMSKSRRDLLFEKPVIAVF